MLQSRFPLVLLALAPLATPPVQAQGSSGMFTEGLVVGDPRDRWEAVVDLNGDGVQDLLGWYYEDSNFDVIRANATLLDGEGGILSMSTALGTGVGYGLNLHATAVGDFEGTGLTQMLVLFGDNVARFEADEDGLLSFVDVIDPVYGASSVTYDRQLLSGDFTGDGVDDFIICNPYRMELWSVVGGTPTFLDTHIWSGWISDFSAGVADMTGDGRLDVVAAHNSYSANYDATVTVYPIEDGLFEPPTDFDFYIAGTKLLATGDVDGDGDSDAVVFVNGFNDFYAVLRQTGPGNLVFEPFAPGGPATHLIDVDGDGDLDGACCSSGGGGGGGATQVTNNSASTFQVCLNDGTGAFDMSMPFNGLGAEHLAGAMDYDGDGDLDLLAGRAVLLNQQAVGADYCSATPNSTGQAAALDATGSASFANNDLTLVASQMPAGKLSIGFFGFQSGSNPFYNGFKCIGGSTKRLKGAGLTTAGGQLTLPVDLTLGSATAIGLGDVTYFQVWYRDLQGGGAFANLTPGVRVLFHP